MRGRPQLFGSRSERILAMLLRQYGHEVIPQKYRTSFDLMIDGKRYEVKAAKPQFRNGSPFWKFNIHRHNHLDERTDFYILRLEEVPYSRKAIHLLLNAPFEKRTYFVSIRSLMNGQFKFALAFRKFLGAHDA